MILPCYTLYKQKCGTDREKFKKISEYVFSVIKKARGDKLVVHDTSIRKWALKRARKVGLENFTASGSWIAKFKRLNRIVDGKITKFTCSKPTRSLTEIEDEGVRFHIELVENINPHFLPSQILNSDQSGINYETHGGRTLSFRGEKSTEAIIQSFNSLSHSYTIMPLLSMEGRLLSPMLICLQEPAGSFGPIVQETMLKPNNLVI